MESMNDKKETVNIFFKNDTDKEKVLKDSSSYERYIILMNELLQSENRDLAYKNADLQQQISQLESDNETYDNSKRYTRGLLKNLVELEKLRNDVSKISKTRFNGIEKYITTYYEQQKQYFTYLKSVIIGIIAVIFHFKFFTTYQFILCFVLVSSPIIFLELHFRKFKIPSYKADGEIIKAKEERIKEISDSQDYLSELIDNI
jgi:hypothetical protein